MWHAAITLCDADYEIESAQLAGLSTASLSYRIMFANDGEACVPPCVVLLEMTVCVRVGGACECAVGGFFSQQISADAHGIIETHIAVLCVVGATFLYVLFVSARSKCWREEPSALVTPKHQRRVGKSARSLVTARAVEAAASGRFRWLRTKAAFWSVIACLMLLAVSSVFSLVYWCTQRSQSARTLRLASPAACVRRYHRRTRLCRSHALHDRQCCVQLAGDVCPRPHHCCGTWMVCCARIVPACGPGCSTSSVRAVDVPGASHTRLCFPSRPSWAFVG